MGLQIVARKYEEEKIWAIGKIIDAALNATNVRWYSGLEYMYLFADNFYVCAINNLMLAKKKVSMHD